MKNKLELDYEITKILFVTFFAATIAISLAGFNIYREKEVFLVIVFISSVIFVPTMYFMRKLRVLYLNLRSKLPDK
jgi:hypothetical protein